VDIRRWAASSGSCSGLWLKPAWNGWRGRRATRWWPVEVRRDSTLAYLMPLFLTPCGRRIGLTLSCGDQTFADSMGCGTPLGWRAGYAAMAPEITEIALFRSLVGALLSTTVWRGKNRSARRLSPTNCWCWLTPLSGNQAWPPAEQSTARLGVCKGSMQAAT